MLEGHRLIVRCGSKVLKGLQWQVRDAQGSPLMQLTANDGGWVDLSGLKEGQRYAFSLMGDPPGGCLEGVARWEDGTGRIIRRFVLSGAQWNLSFLTALPLEGWGWRGLDGSGLPPIDQVAGPMETERGPDPVAHPVVVPTADVHPLVGDLSLIHISEPTRPY